MTAVHDPIAAVLNALDVPRWASEPLSEWEWNGEAFHRQVNGQVYEAEECHIPDQQPFSAHVYCSLWQSTDGQAVPSVELTLDASWANMTSASARSLARALLSAADELDAASA